MMRVPPVRSYLFVTNTLSSSRHQVRNVLVQQIFLRSHTSHTLVSPTAAGTSTNSSSRRRVDPSVRQRRPHVNGEPVAFHVRDLVPRDEQKLKRSVPNAFSDLRNRRLEGSDQPRVNNARSNAATNGVRRGRRYDSDLVVVLDMDECLIHSQFLSDPAAAQVYAHQLQSQRRGQQDEDSATVPPLEFFHVELPRTGDLVHVNIRPGLFEFLDNVTNKFETHIFTAAQSVYANPVLNYLDPHGTKFAARWYREHCRWDGVQNAYIKDLDALPIRNLARAVLVDNNPLSFLSHPSNGILVQNFFTDPNDSGLPVVWEILQELDKEDDVRPLLEERFALREKLQQLKRRRWKSREADRKAVAWRVAPNQTDAWNF